MLINFEFPVLAFRNQLPWTKPFLNRSVGLNKIIYLSMRLEKKIGDLLLSCLIISYSSLVDIFILSIPG